MRVLRKVGISDLRKYSKQRMRGQAMLGSSSVLADKSRRHRTFVQVMFTTMLFLDSSKYVH